MTVPTLAILTPSYRPDFDLFTDLHTSVLRWTGPDVVHHVVVPRADRAMFASFEGPRCRIVTEEDLLPRRFVRIPGQYTVNARRPLPPIRGWILQQIIKLAAAAALTEDLVLLVDSDVELVRQVGSEDFVQDDGVLLYRQPSGVQADMPRHVRWHQVARSMLGLPPASPPLPDYVTSFMLWETHAVRALVQRVESVAGRPWQDVVGRQLHFSEWTLYGVFVEELLRTSSVHATTDDRCHNYWEAAPLSPEDAASFVASLEPSDLAIMISAKSRTPLAVRREALAPLRGRA